MAASRYLFGLAFSIAIFTCPAFAELILDEFDYGSGNKSLCYLGDASQGWGGSWSGYCNAVTYDGTVGMCWPVTGYTCAPATGGIEFGSYQDMVRSFGHSLTGRFWVSFMVDSDAYSGARDVNFTADDVIFFGFDGANSPTVTPFIDVTRSDAPLFTGPTVSAGDPHLVVMKWELSDAPGGSRISMWVDPPSLTGGEAGLGTPSVLATGLTIDHWNVWHIAFANLSLADALRVSFAGSTPASLAEVLLGQPVPLRDSPEALRCQSRMAAASAAYVKRVFTETRQCLDDVAAARLAIPPSACTTYAPVIAEHDRRAQTLRAAISRACGNSVLSQVHACAAAVDALVSADGQGGCLVEALDRGVDEMIGGVYGGLF